LFRLLLNIIEAVLNSRSAGALDGRVVLYLINTRSTKVFL